MHVCARARVCVVISTLQSEFNSTTGDRSFSVACEEHKSFTLEYCRWTGWSAPTDYVVIDLELGIFKAELFAGACVCACVHQLAVISRLLLAH